MRVFDFQYPPAVILDTEEQYPGLWNELMYFIWQEQLIDHDKSSKGGR